MTSHEIALLTKIAFANWPRYEVTPELVTSWRLALGNSNYHDALEALGSILKNPEKEFPPIAAEVLNEVQRIERNRTPQLSPPNARRDGEVMETYALKQKVAGKEVVMNYIRATPQARAEYMQRERAAGRRVSFVRDPRSGEEL